MKQVAILAIEGATSFSVMGSLDMLSKANGVSLGSRKQESYFRPSLVAVSDKLVKSATGHPFFCDQSLADGQSYDLILIPSCDGDITETISHNTSLIPWLQEQYAAGAHIASMCTGAFLLAKTGLLDGKSATTHWAYADLFQQLFPKVNLRIAENIVDHGSMICAGGGTSFPHLIMYLIEKYYGHEMAVLCSKMMLVDLDRVPQSAYSIFTAYKQHGDEVILKAQTYIEHHFHMLLSIAKLADEVAVSERTLIRRFKAATGLTPIDYIQRVRVEEAKKLLENGDATIVAITDAIGYSDLGSFRRVFKKQTGVSLKVYRQKFGQMGKSNA